jgi:hypothetical protein
MQTTVSKFNLFDGWKIFSTTLALVLFFSWTSAKSDKGKADICSVAPPQIRTPLLLIEPDSDPISKSTICSPRTFVTCRKRVAQRTSTRELDSPGK